MLQQDEEISQKEEKRETDNNIANVKAEISRIKSRLEAKFGKGKVNEQQLNNLVQEYKESTNKASFLYNLNDNDYLLDPPPSDNNSSDNETYPGVKAKKNPDGSFSGYGSDGKYFEGKDFKDLNNKILESFKNKALQEQKEPKASFYSDNKENVSIFAHEAIVNYGMTIGRNSCYPKDKKFWQNLKQEYLQNEGNSFESWEKITRNISDEAMGRTKEESKKNKALIKQLADKKSASFIRKLRNGNNPNLTPLNPASRPSHNSSRSNSEAVKKFALATKHQRY